MFLCSPNFLGLTGFEAAPSLRPSLASLPLHPSSVKSPGVEALKNPALPLPPISLPQGGLLWVLARPWERDASFPAPGSSEKQRQAWGDHSAATKLCDSSSPCHFPATLCSRAPKGVRTNAALVGTDAQGDDAQAAGQGGAGKKRQGGGENNPL